MENINSYLKSHNSKPVDWFGRDVRDMLIEDGKVGLVMSRTELTFLMQVLSNASIREDYLALGIAEEKIGSNEDYEMVRMAIRPFVQELKGMGFEGMIDHPSVADTARKLLEE